MNGGGICLDLGTPGPNRFVVDPNPTVGFGGRLGCDLAFVLAVCRLSDDTVKFNEGLIRRRETVIGPWEDEDMENPGDGVRAVAYFGGGTLAE